MKLHWQARLSVETLPIQRPTTKWSRIPLGALRWRGLLNGKANWGGFGEGWGPRSWCYYAGEYITSSITTAGDLNAWNRGESTSGAYMVASKALAQKYTDEELVHSLLYGFLADGTCSAGTYEDFNRPPYSGKIQIWRDCDQKDSTYVVLAASPTEDRKCVAVLGVEAVSEAGREALGHILDTFEVDSANSAKPRSERRVGLLP